MANNKDNKEKNEIAANCDLKRRTWATLEVHALRIYRKWSRNA